MPVCGDAANDTGRSGAGDETTGRNVMSDGEADHLVSGSGDPGDQLPADAALVPVTRSLAESNGSFAGVRGTSAGTNDRSG